MEITVTPKPERSEVSLSVVATPEEFAPFVERAATKLSQGLDIKGFRPGKAPKQLVIDQVGADRLLHEAMDQAIPHFFAQAALEKQVQVVHRPSITVEELGLDTPFRFSATVEVVPEITLADPKKLSVKKRDVAVTDEEVDAELKHLAKMRGTLAQVDREAKNGDVVTVDFEVQVDGKAIEGGTSKNHPITLGEGRFVPGFEEGLLGAKAGDDKTFPISFPEDYGKKELQGKKAQATAHVHSVQERTLPELNDEFAKGLGSFTDMEHLKKDLKKNITDEMTAKEEERYVGELAEKLMEKSTFGFIPESLINHEIDRRMEEFANMLAYQQKTIDDYIAEHSTSLESMRENMKESAEKQVKIGLALRELAKKHDIVITDEEIEAETQKQLARFASVKQAHEEINPNELREYVVGMLKNTKTLDLLKSLAN